MPDTKNPANRYTLKEWIRHPTTIMLIIAVNALWLVGTLTFNSYDEKAEIWKEVAEYFKAENKQLKKDKEEYTTTVLFKNGQLKNRDEVIELKNTEIDSLKAVISELKKE